MNDLSAPALVTAVEENLFEYYKLFRQWTRVEVHDDKHMLWTLSDVPSPFFNNVLNAQIAPNEVDATIEVTITRYRLRNAFINWWIGPATKPANLGMYLEQHGFVHRGNPPGMAVDLLALNEGLPALPGLVIEQVSDVATLKQWCHVFSVGFGMRGSIEDPLIDLFTSIGLGDQFPIRHYIGWLDGKPVATSQLFLGAGVAGIYDVATVPEARQQGYGTALTLAALLKARSLGYRVGILQSSEMGFGVYYRIGFREYCRLSRYIWMNRSWGIKR